MPLPTKSSGDGWGRLAFNKWQKPVPEHFSVLCFGDSITEGNTLPEGERGLAWIPRVERMSEGRLRLINEGMGGRSTDSLAEFHATLERHRNEPVHLLILALGTNDSRDISGECVAKAVMNVGEMVDAVHIARPDCQVLLIGPPNLRKDTLGPTRGIADQRAQNLASVNGAYFELARRTGHSFLGLYGVLSPDTLAVDGIHPDKEGHREIARVIHGALIKMMRCKSFGPLPIDDGPRP